MSTTEWNVHDLVRVRVEDAPAVALQHIREELREPVPVTSERADITIRFVERLPISGRLRLIGMQQAAFDDDRFFLLGDGGARTAIDLATAGEETVLTVERGVRHLPLLVPLLGLHLVRRGHVLVHASSFVHRGRGVLVAGWAKGGKSETLVPFMAAGAEFVADEWTIIGGEPADMRGIASTALWEWHLRQFPEYWSRLSPAQRRRIGAWRAARSVHDRVPGTGRIPRPVRRRLGRLLTEGGHPVQAAGQLDPELVFEGRVRRTPAPLDRVILPIAVPDDDVTLVPTDGRTVAARMVHSLAFERSALAIAYQQHRFAFPDRVNPAIEAQAAEEERLLTRALVGVPAFELRHPYPVDLRALVAGAEPVLAD